MIKEGSGSDEVEASSSALWLDLLWLIIGSVSLFAGSTLAIKGSLNLVEIFGISKGFAGAVILAAGTGLPEFITTIVAGFKKEISLAFANILGSNALNAFAVLGTSAALFPFSINTEMATTNTLVLVAISLLGLAPLLLFKKQILFKVWAAALLTSYFVFGYISF